MNHHPSSRRQFLSLAGGIALALRHGLVPAAALRDAATGASVPTRAVATLHDGLLRIEWDARLHTRLSRRVGADWLPLTRWAPADYLLRSDGRHIADFAFQRRIDAVVDDEHGPGTQLALVGKAAEGVEKTLTVTLYERHPGIALVRATYRNTSPETLVLRSWTNGDTRLPARRRDAATAAGPPFWCYSGATYEDRRDWVQPLGAGFTQDNFLGMQASDYGGGTPIVDAWRRDGGVAVGHAEPKPLRVSLPVSCDHAEVRLAVCGREKRSLAAGDSLSTPQTFVAVHGGDYFATLVAYRRLMSERGLTPAPAPAAAYEPIWCAWGYERACTTALIEGTLAKAADLGLKWAVIDDGWQSMIGDWTPDRVKYPAGDADVRSLVADIRAAGLKPRLWFSPLAVAPGSDALHDHTDMLLVDKDGAPQQISWWNSFYLCPAYAPTIAHTRALVAKFIGDWGFAGLKIDGQHLNNVAPCFNPAHGHARPEESVEGLQAFYHALYETATRVNPEVVMELCPCGTAFSAFNFPSMNQAPASDPESSWQVRHKGKTLKGLMGPGTAYAGDHVELSDGQADFASTVGVGAVISTKFTWPLDPKPKDSFLLTPDRERAWRHWITLAGQRMLVRGEYRGELYDIGFDRPEAHAIRKDERMYYAFYAPRWDGTVELRGLAAGHHRIRDYVNDRELGTVSGPTARLAVSFEHALLVEALPA
jgi:alpha-galactosidase